MKNVRYLPTSLPTNLVNSRGFCFGRFFNLKHFGFTLTEVLLAITILGIIVVVMIGTIKPQRYKEKALEVAAKKVMNQIDYATSMILINDSLNGTMERLLSISGTEIGLGRATGEGYQVKSGALADLYKKYLTVSRKPCDTEACPCYNSIYTTGQSFYLKDGACILTTAMTEYATHSGYVFPGEDYDSVKNINAEHSGTILFDINGEEGPNEFGKDKFEIPIGKYGILYNATETE